MLMFFENFDRTIENFMEQQRKADEYFIKTLLKDDLDGDDEDEFIIKIREKGHNSFFECDLKEKTVLSVLDIITEEFSVSGSEVAVLMKLPDVIIRSYKDVRRLKPNAEIEFVRMSDIVISS